MSMSLAQFLKKYRARLEIGDKWLYWQVGIPESTFIDAWVVRQHKYRAKGSTVLYCGQSLIEALRVLGKGEL